MLAIRSSTTLFALALAAMMLIGASPGVSRATWPSDPSVNVPLCTAPGGQGGSIISDGADGAIAVWRDERRSYDLYAQRVTAAGTLKWTRDGVLVYMGSDIIGFPSVISDGAGGAIIAWHDGRNGGVDNLDVYAQRVDASGAPLWTANGVAICTVENVQGSPVLVSDGAGGAIIVWDDHRDLAGHIFAQRVNAEGVAQWTENGVPVFTAVPALSPGTVVSDGAGGAIVAWGDFGRGGDFTQHNIYAQRISAAGEIQWTASGVPICTARDRFKFPSGIVSDGAGGAILTWEDHRDGSVFPGHVYVQRVDASGVTRWTTDGVALGGAANDQASPIIVSDGAGGTIVTWWDLRGGVSDVYAQRVNVAGEIQWTASGVPICTAANSQRPSDIIPDGTGSAIIAWEDHRGGGFGHGDIYAQRVNARGEIQWTANGVAVCTAAGEQAGGRGVPDGAGGAILDWGDNRNELSTDIYAQRVLADGTLGCPAAPMSVTLRPRTLSLRSMGRWLTAILEPEPPASPADIDIASILLNNTVAVDALAPTSIGDVDSDGRPELTVKFDRAAVELTVDEGDAVTVTVTGGIGDGCFEATDVIRVIRAHVVAPSAGNVLQAGSQTEVRWDTPAGIQVKWVALQSSNDDGASWTLEANHLPNSGTYVWTVPSDATEQARVAVVPVESADESDIEVNGVLGVSERFVIAQPLAVGGTSIELALQGAVPNPSRGLTVSFSLRDAEPATLAVYDASGRELSRREVGGLGAGRHLVRLGAPGTLAPGIYLVHLIQRDRRLVARAVVVQ